MGMAYNYCKVCNKFLVTKEANYCSTQCRSLNGRLYYSKIGLVSSFLSLMVFVIYGVVRGLDLVYIGLILVGTTLMVIIPLYQFRQSTKIEQRLKKIYNEKTTVTTKEGKQVQPVYIYLYINRHTENMLPDEDYSEYV